MGLEQDQDLEQDHLLGIILDQKTLDFDLQEAMDLKQVALEMGLPHMDLALLLEDMDL